MPPRSAAIAPASFLGAPGRRTRRSLGVAAARASPGSRHDEHRAGECTRDLGAQTARDAISPGWSSASASLNVPSFNRDQAAPAIPG